MQSLDQFYQLSAKKRLELITNHEDPKELVSSFNSQDLLLTIRELGVESSLELFELMKPEQVQELFDLELWENDQLKSEEAGNYISALFEANPETAILQMHGLDIELIGLLFKTSTMVLDLSIEEPEDYPNLHSTTPGGRFVVFFDEENNKALARALHTFLEELYSRDLEFVLRMLENVRYELASGLEMESLRWRQNRLLDFGILPHEERLEYFSSVDPNALLVAAKPKPLGLEKTMALIHKNSDLKDRHFLRAALNDASIETKEIFSQELSHAALNMHASLSGDFGDRRAMVASSEYAKYLCELGLFQACLGQIEKAALTLKSASAKYFIRLGRTALVSLRKRLNLKTKDQSYLFGDNFAQADSPLREVARAISLPEPRYYEGLLDPKKLTVRFFGSLTELNLSVQAINELIFRAELLGERGLNIGPLGLNHQHLTHSGIFARVFINRFLGEENVLSSITFAGFGQIASAGRINDDFKNYLRAEGKELAQKIFIADEKQMEKVDNFINTILIQLEQNWQLLVG